MNSGSIELSGQTIHWQTWGDTRGKPVLALHGWLDNSASFIKLAPQLKDMFIVAIDMAGHGYSDHRPWPGSYNIWDDLIDILALADHFGWDHFSLLGHSRGAIIAALFAASQPERIDKLILLDGIIPEPAKVKDTAKQLGRYLAQHSLRANKASPSYQQFDNAMNARCKAASMTPSTAMPILDRGLVQGDDRLWRWRSDPRLTMDSAVKFSLEQIDAYVNAISCPALLLLASEGIAKHEAFVAMLSSWSNIEKIQFAGSHHFHLEPVSSELAETINTWF
jgi:pimeloyl-ACP methyl ester carboxylesterase